MDIFLIIIGAICLLLGLIGCVAPVLPGVPLSYLGLLLLHFTDRVQFSWQFLVVWGVVVVVIQILDYFIPAWGTKKFGGTKAGVRGSTIGLIVGVVVLPILGVVIGPFGLIGILAGPFVGAYIGEKMSGVDDNLAWRSAIGSFVGFVAGTLLKVVYSLVVGFVVIKDIITSFL